MPVVKTNTNKTYNVTFGMMYMLKIEVQSRVCVCMWKYKKMQILQGRPLQ